MEIDETDRAILRILQEDARTPFSEVARRIDMSSATVHDRVNRMEETGVIEGYHASVDPKAVGYDVSAFVGLRIEQGHEEDAIRRLREIDGVCEVHLTTGEWDVLLKIVAADTDSIRELTFDRIAAMEGFAQSQTMIILDTDYEADGPPM